jgi:putative acetyltransferase
MLTLTRTDSDHPDFRALVAQLDRDLEGRYGAAQAFYAQFNHLSTIRHALVAHSEGQAVGCGAFRPYDAHSVEIKRMYVPPAQRGRGIAAEVLRALEHWAAEVGYTRCILETGNQQPEAIRLYQKAGYTRMPNFGQYADDESSLCMEKNLEK